MVSYAWDLTDEDREIADLKEKYYLLTEKNKLERLREQYEKQYQNMHFEDRPKVFIYTPTYNRGEILKERALKSVLNQTYDNFEYLVVGDACTDHTEEIVLSCEDKRVRFFSVPQRGWRYPPSAENHWLAGPVIAANTALAMADGIWIARIDDDDYWVEDHIEVMLKKAIEGDWEFVSGAYKIHKDGEDAISRGENLYGNYFQIPFPDNDMSIYNPRIGGTSSIFYRFYLRYFEYNLDCWRKRHNRVNDVDLYVRFGMAGVRMGFSDRVEFYCMPRPGEETIGSEAYKRSVSQMEQHFKF